MKINLYNFKDQVFVCSNCEWRGKGKVLSLGEIYMDSAIVEYDCPKCFEKIAYGQGNLTNIEMDDEDDLNTQDNQEDPVFFRSLKSII